MGVSHRRVGRVAAMVCVLGVSLSTAFAQTDRRTLPLPERASLPVNADQEVFRASMEAYGERCGLELTRRGAGQVFTRADADGDAHLDQRELMRLMERWQGAVRVVFDVDAEAPIRCD